jgi:excisionase family DNA binding protein
MKLSDLITAAQAAEILGLSKERVSQLCKQGRIQAVKPGRDWVMLRQTVQAFSKIDRPEGRPPA